MRKTRLKNKSRRASITISSILHVATIIICNLFVVQHRSAQHFEFMSYFHKYMCYKMRAEHIRTSYEQRKGAVQIGRDIYDRKKIE